MSLRRLVQLAAALVLALVIASCGGGDSASSTAAETSTTSSTQGTTGSAYLAAKIATAEGAGGVAVAAVAEGGAAETAGVRPGDVIVAIDGTKTDTADALVAELARREAGDAVELTVKRGAKTMKLNATLDERPATVPD